MEYIPIKVKAIKKYLIWIQYKDGTSGKVDLSDLSEKPVFKFWNEKDNFSKVYINSRTGAIAWSDEIELCSDSLYYEIKHIDPVKEIFITR